MVPKRLVACKCTYSAFSFPSIPRSLLPLPRQCILGSKDTMSIRKKSKFVFAPFMPRPLVREKLFL
uniref:Uncharacterized protein n=1 Tax=Megaselia scalaris TaxID=36166 RepID=T1GNR9_MEGSC